MKEDNQKVEFPNKPKKRRRSSAEVRAAMEREEMINGFIEIMDDALFIDGNGQGREGYVAGMRECAERITDAVLNGIKGAIK